MSDPIILSDEETEAEDLNTPLPKKPRTEPGPTIILLDDDPTPQKPLPAPASVSPPLPPSSSSRFASLVVPETPASDISIFKCSVGPPAPASRVSASGICPKDLSVSPPFHPSSSLSCFASRVVPKTPASDISIVECSVGPSAPAARVFASGICPKDLSWIMCLESEDDEPGSGPGEEFREGNVTAEADVEAFLPSPPRFWCSQQMHGDVRSTLGASSSRQPIVEDDCVYQMEDCNKQNFAMDEWNGLGNMNEGISVNLETKLDEDKPVRKKTSKEERDQMREEQKQRKEQEKLKKAASKAQEKLQKEALKVQAAEMKRLEKEKKKWETGKFALKSIVAEIDAKVVEQGSIGGHLLTKFSEKSLAYRITTNPIDRCILWRMTIPEKISQLTPEGAAVQYVLLVYDAEEFCNLVANELLLEHVARVRSHYPSYTICYLTNRLMAYINKRERELYKNPEIDGGWRCPPIEEVLAKLTTHYHRVHYRHCRDEAEVAEHVVGLTCSLASCQYRTKLTRLSVTANGSVVPQGCVERNLIKKNTWLKALVAIPKVQPRCAIAIWKKYPTMKSLLREYMDPTKSVHEKEFILQDLTMEGLLGGERRVGQVCSKRVYRVLMAQSGSIKTDDVEDGADRFQ